jgi:hypothetical protein
MKPLFVMEPQFFSDPREEPIYLTCLWIGELALFSVHIFKGYWTSELE